MKRSGPDNSVKRNLIVFLEKQAKKAKAPIWAKVAKMLGRPARKEVKANLYKLSRNFKEGHALVVSGKVLSLGEAEKKMTVAAFSFSEKAREKIEKAGGKAVSLKEFAESNPKGSKTIVIA